MVMVAFIDTAICCLLCSISVLMSLIIGFISFSISFLIPILLSPLINSASCPALSFCIFPISFPGLLFRHPCRKGFGRFFFVLLLFLLSKTETRQNPFDKDDLLLSQH